VTADAAAATPGMRAGAGSVPTINLVILISSPRPEGVAVVVVLPQGSQLLLDFHDGETVDISSITADVLVNYLLNPSGTSEATDTRTLGSIRLAGGDAATIRFATVDLYSGAVGEVPGERLLPLLTVALTASLEAAAFEQQQEQADASGANADDMP